MRIEIRIKKGKKGDTYPVAPDVAQKVAVKNTTDGSNINNKDMTLWGFVIFIFLLNTYFQFVKCE